MLMRFALTIAAIAVALIPVLVYSQGVEEPEPQSRIERLESENQSLRKMLDTERQSRLATQRNLLARIHEDAYGKRLGGMSRRTKDDDQKALKDLAVEIAPSFKHDIFIARILKRTDALEGISVAEAERLLGPQNHYGARETPRPNSWMFDNGKKQIYYSINATLRDGKLVDWHFITH